MRGSAKEKRERERIEEREKGERKCIIMKERNSPNKKLFVFITLLI